MSEGSALPLKYMSPLEESILFLNNSAFYNRQCDACGDVFLIIRNITVKSLSHSQRAVRNWKVEMVFGIWFIPY